MIARGKDWWRSPDTWTFFDQLLVRTGGTCIVMGFLAHVLPFFGLQFTKLAKLGNAAPAAGTGLAVFGAFLVLYVLLFKGRILRALLGAAALLLVGFLTLLVIGWFSSRRAPFPPQLTMPPMQPGLQPPGGSPWGPSGPPGASGPAGGVPQPTPPPRMDHDALVARFGAERVVRVKFEGADAIDVAASVRELFKRPAAVKPGSWVISTRGGEILMSMAPIDSLDAASSMLPLGDVVGTDQGQRLIVLRLDPTRCVAKK